MFYALNGRKNAHVNFLYLVEQQCSRRFLSKWYSIMTLSKETPCLIGKESIGYE